MGADGAAAANRLRLRLEWLEAIVRAALRTAFTSCADAANLCDVATLSQFEQQKV